MIETKTKKAVFLGGKQLSEYKWDSIRIYENHNIAIATNENSEFALYSLYTGKLLFELDNIVSYRIKANYVEITVERSDILYCGAISFSGELVVAFSFKTVKNMICANVYEVILHNDTKAYYFTKTGQTINADDIKTRNDFEYELLINGKWIFYWYSRPVNKDSKFVPLGEL